VLKLQERARVLMIAWLALSAVYSAYVAIAPGPRARMRELRQSFQMEGVPPPPAFDTPTFVVVMMLMGVALVVLAIWFLVRNKRAFYSDNELPAPANPISR
jgi:hypothetical protein